MQKSVRIALSLLMAFSLVSFPAQANLALGVAIGSATNNMALGIAVGVALQSSNSSDSSPETVKMDVELSDGRTEFLANEAASFLKVLFKGGEGVDAELAQQLQKTYGNAKDVNIFLRSLFAGDYLKIYIEEAGDYKDFVEALRQVTKADKMQKDLVGENTKLGIELKDSALTNVLEVHKGAGLLVATERLFRESNWKMGDVLEKGTEWLSTELIDLRFDIQANEKLSPTDVYRYQAQFGLTVLASIYDVLGDSVKGLLGRVYQNFRNGKAYQSFMAREKAQPVRFSGLGVTAVIVLSGIGIAAGVWAWSSFYTEILRGWGYHYSMIDFVVFILSPVIKGSLAGYLTGKFHLSRKAIKRRLQIEGFREKLQQDKPLLEAFKKFNAGICRIRMRF